MIDNWFEFELNAVKYKGRSVGGEPPLRESGQALRAQNAQLVQGESSAVFNMRPDVLVFSWTDWSGGEGQTIFDPQQPNRYKVGRSINAFARPGTVFAGPAVERTTDSGGTNPIKVECSLFQPQLALRGDSLHLTVQSLSGGATDGKVHTWDNTNKKWDAGVAIDSSAVSAERGADGDGANLYISDGAELISFDGAADAVFANNHLITSSAVVELGNYVYHISMTNPGATASNGVAVREYLKSTAPLVTGTLIYSAPGYGHNLNFPNGVLGMRLVTDGPNRIYLATVQGLTTTIHEIVPTTAAAAGYGAAIATIPAQGLSMVWSGGLLFLHCNLLGVDSAEQTGHGVLMYVNPTDGTYGIVDRVRPFGFSKGTVYSGSTQREGASLAENYFALMAAETAGGAYKTEVMVLDTEAGALHSYARAELGHSDVGPISIGRYRGDIFVAESSAASAYVLRLIKDKYEGANAVPMVTSPAWDFGLVDEKLLSSLRVSCEAVPTNWTIAIDYDLDGSGSWVNAGSVVATNDGATFTISTDSTTKKFRTLSLRARFIWAGSGDPTTTPVLLGIDARAQVSQKLRSWTVILDCSDDEAQAQSQSLKGHQKIDNIQSVGTPNGNVVAFKNGYSHRMINQYDEYDVIVDDYEIFYQKPGEAYAVVRLIEVA